MIFHCISSINVPLAQILYYNIGAELCQTATSIIENISEGANNASDKMIAQRPMHMLCKMRVLYAKVFHKYIANI